MDTKSNNIQRYIGSITSDQMRAYGAAFGDTLAQHLSGDHTKLAAEYKSIHEQIDHNAYRLEIRIVVGLHRGGGYVYRPRGYFALPQRFNANWMANAIPPTPPTMTHIEISVDTIAYVSVSPEWLVGEVWHVETPEYLPGAIADGIPAFEKVNPRYMAYLNDKLL